MHGSIHTATVGADASLGEDLPDGFLDRSFGSSREAALFSGRAFMQLFTRRQPSRM
jgi:hypothetical protein